MGMNHILVSHVGWMDVTGTYGPMRLVARDMARGVAEHYGLIFGLSKSLCLVAKTFVLVAREAPALLIAALLFALIIITYFGSQVLFIFSKKFF